VGSERVTIRAGSATTVGVALDRTGRRLLARERRLEARLVVTGDRHTLRTQTITFTAARSRTHKPNVEGGSPVTEAGVWPWAVVLLLDTTQGAALCSGELIGPTTVLTAAHCVQGLESVIVSPTRDASAWFDVNQADVPSPSETVGPSAVVPDPLFNPSLETDGDPNDLAIVKLPAPLPGTTYLPVLQPDQTGPFEGSFDALFAGYGITSPNGRDAGVLYQIEIGAGPDPYPNMILGGGLNSDTSGTCEGDSGGPLIVPIWGGSPPVTTNPTAANGDWAVIGTTNTGPSNTCNSTNFARLSSYSTFLLPYETPVDYVPPSVSGDPAVGSQLSCDPGTWSVPVSVTYSWETVGLDGATPIGGADGQTYTPQASDLGSELECEVQATAAGFGSPNTATSAPAVAVTATTTNGDWCGPSSTTTTTTTTQVTLPFTGLPSPYGVAVDAAGDVFATSFEQSGTPPAQVAELPAVGSQVTPAFSGLSEPQGVAVDAAGDVFVADAGNDDVVEAPAGGGSQVTLPFTGLSAPGAVAVDAAGDVFVADAGKADVVELPAGGGPQVTLPFTGLSDPRGVAVDAAGDVFVADAGNADVVELPAGGGPQVTLPFTGLGTANGVAVDATGDVFVTTKKNVVELPAGGGAQETLPFTGLKDPWGVAVDRAGDVFVANDDDVVELTAGGTVTVPTGASPVIEPTSSCGLLSGDGESGADISVPAGTAVSDQASLSGTNAVAATGTVTYDVYSDEACTDLVAAGSPQDITTAGALPASPAQTLGTPGTYYWQAVYGGDPLNAGSTSPCGSQVETVVPLAPVNTAPPSVSGTAQDGLVLSRSGRGSWSDAGALSYADQWERCSSTGAGCAAVPGATGTVYRATAADVGHKLELAVTATDQYGLTATATSGATGVVADPVAPAATVLPAFTGVAQKGQVLTITGRGSWTSPDQLTFSEQWERCDSTGAGCTAIAGATGFVYRVSTADYGGHEITVAVTATDQEGQQTTALATPSAVVPTPAPVEIAAPLVTGSPVDGQVLTRAATGMWSSPLALSFSGQWERCDDTGANCQAIPSATGYVYRLKAADVGHEVTLAITATDTMGQQTTASATATAVVGVPPAPVNTIVPAFSGTATQGQVLTITGRGTWTSPDTLSYGEQWERCDDTGTNCVAIPGATGFVYRLSAADVGDEVTVQVTATDQEGQTTTATATPTAIVTAALPES
jgi:hypothetical protein